MNGPRSYLGKWLRIGVVGQCGDLSPTMQVYYPTEGYIPCRPVATPLAAKCPATKSKAGSTTTDSSRRISCGTRTGAPSSSSSGRVSSELSGEASTDRSILGNFANGFDGALVNGLQLLPAWQTYFNNPTGSTLGLLAASQSIGALGSILIAPFVNDAFGRKRTVMLGGAIMLTGAALQTAASSVGMYCGARAMLGFGGG